MHDIFCSREFKDLDFLSEGCVIYSDRSRIGNVKCLEDCSTYSDVIG